MPACCRQVFKFLADGRTVQKNPTIATEQAAWRCPRVRPACSRQVDKSCQASSFVFSGGTGGAMFPRNTTRPRRSTIATGAGLLPAAGREAGVFERIFEALAGEGADLSTLMIDTSHIKTHRIAANGVKKTTARGEPSARPKAA